MRRLRDSSELREAADLLESIVKETVPRGVADARGERLRRILVQLCTRAGFSTAVVAGGDGLPLAAHGLSFPLEAAGAVMSIMGDALKRVSSVLERREPASSMTIDLSYADKLVVRRFSEGEGIFFLRVVCPLHVDEHAEIEVSIDEISRLVRGA